MNCFGYKELENVNYGYEFIPAELTRVREIDDSLTVSEVLMHVIYMHDVRGRCRFDVDTIAAETELSAKEVIKCFKAFVEAGYFEENGRLIRLPGRVMLTPELQDDWETEK